MPKVFSRFKDNGSKVCIRSSMFFLAQETKYIYTRFAYGTLRCLWSRTKHSSQQCSDSEWKIRKSELSAVASKAQFEAVQWLWRKDRLGRTAFSSAQTLAFSVFRALRHSKKQARAAISSALWLLSTLEQWFRAPSGYWARLSSDFERSIRKHCACAVISSAVEQPSPSDFSAQTGDSSGEPII